MTGDTALPVVIVGAGIGGLFTALRLHQDGVACEVYEQADPIRALGVGINLLPEAVTELARVGLLDALDAVAIRTSTLTQSVRDGRVITRESRGLDAGHAVPQFSIHRGELQRVLLDAALERGIPVRTGHRAVGFFTHPDGVKVRFVDRGGYALPSVRGSVLVGADGIHSVVRATLFSDGPPRWEGIMMWRGAVPWPVFGDGRSMIIAGGLDAKLVVYPIGAGPTPDTRVTNWAICVRTGRPGDQPPRREDWSRPADRDELNRQVGLFSVPEVDVVGLVAATETPLEYPMVDRDPLPVWTDGRVALLGDAAHAMWPVGSMGGREAIKDGVFLSACLTTHADPAQALCAYQAERLPITNDLIIANRRGGSEGVIDAVEAVLRADPDADWDRLTERDRLQQIMIDYQRSPTRVTPDI